MFIRRFSDRISVALGPNRPAEARASRRLRRKLEKHPDIDDVHGLELESEPLGDFDIFPCKLALAKEATRTQTRTFPHHAASGLAAAIPGVTVRWLGGKVQWLRGFVALTSLASGESRSSRLPALSEYKSVTGALYLLLLHCPATYTHLPASFFHLQNHSTTSNPSKHHSHHHNGIPSL